MPRVLSVCDNLDIVLLAGQAAAEGFYYVCSLFIQTPHSLLLAPSPLLSAPLRLALRKFAPQDCYAHTHPKPIRQDSGRRYLFSAPTHPVSLLLAPSPRLCAPPLLALRRFATSRYAHTYPRPSPAGLRASIPPYILAPTPTAVHYPTHVAFHPSDFILRCMLPPQKLCTCHLNYFLLLSLSLPSAPPRSLRNPTITVYAKWLLNKSIWMHSARRDRRSISWEIRQRSSPMLARRCVSSGMLG